MPAEPDELLTVNEIAERLKVNPQTVRNWLERGELQGLRLGSRRVRVASSALDAFIKRSSDAQRPDEQSARRAYTDALAAVDAAKSPAEQATALRAVAKSATRLARALHR